MFQAVIDPDNSRWLSRMPNNYVRLSANLNNHVATGSVELHVDSQGRWSVKIGPALGYGGEFQTVATGELPLATTDD